MKPTCLAWLPVAVALTACADAADEDAAVAEAEGPHHVLVEVDRMQGTSPIRFEQSLDGAHVSLVDIYRAADLELRIVEDQDDLPRQETVRLADLHGLMMAHSGVAADPDEWKIHVLVVTADPDDDRTLGVMFDFDDNDDNDIPRQAFAVYETPHRNLSGGTDPEMLLTTAHELAHAFNIHHTDWEGAGFYGGATIESYSPAGSVRWELSPASLEHFRSHHPFEIQPGNQGWSFGNVQQVHLDSHQSFPVESYSVTDPNQLARMRAEGGGGASSSRREGITAVDLGRHHARLLPRTHPLRLALRAPKATYELGEPVVLTVELHNAGEARQEVVPLLEPEYGFLGIHVRGPDGSGFRPYRPPVLREGREAPRPVLRGNQALYSEAKVFFGADGWTFKESGEYVILADFPSSPDPGSPRITSDSLPIRIVEPSTPSGRRAAEALRVDGRLGLQEGLFLYLEGGDHLIEGKRSLEEVVENSPDAPQAPGARLALARAALHPTVDPRRRIVPDVDRALRYLSGLDTQDLPPLSVLRIQGETAQLLEASNRGTEARALRARVVETVDRETIPRMDRSQIVEAIE